jgi:UDP-N-acetylglucosamine transferase subunit ALG13
MEWAPLLSPDEFSQCVAEADLLVAHAGMGSILSALTAGKPIVVLPRRGHFAETRNDHQMATAVHLQSFAGIHVAWDETEIAARIDGALQVLDSGRAERLPRFANHELTGRLRAFLTLGK